MSEALIRYQGRPLAADPTTCKGCGRVAKPVTDHCHEHGWVRAIVCGSCNRHLASVDRGVVPRAGLDAAILAALVDIRNRCPECVPLDISELATLPLVRITVDLSDELYEALRLVAFNERCSVSEAVRTRLARTTRTL